MSWIFIGLGATILLIATVVRAGLPILDRGRRSLTRALAVAASLSLAVLWVSVVFGTHTVITSSDQKWTPSPFNGWKVYLSSPRHAESGTPGRECGWEENINGRHWNYNATHANGGGAGGLLNRGYSVTVSANARDNGAWINKNSSNNWGANVHIVTHTNGIVGCPESFQYLLVMYRTGFWGSTDLRDHLLAKLDPVLPGGQNTWNCDNLLECTQVNAAHRAYVELFFHTNQASVNWFQTAGVPEANTWRYGYAVDDHLNYP